MFKKLSLLSFVLLLTLSLLTSNGYAQGAHPTFTVDTELAPKPSEISPLFGEVPRQLAAVFDASGSSSMSFIDNQLIIRVDEDEGMLNEFLDRYNGTVLKDGSLPNSDEPGRFRLVQIDLDSVDLSALNIEENGATLGLLDHYTVSSKTGLKLLAVLFDGMVQGIPIFPEMPADLYNEEHPDGNGQFLDPDGQCSSAIFIEVCDSSLHQTNTNLAWRYLRTHGFDQSTVNLAIIDRGYLVDPNGNWLFGVSDLPRIPAAQRYDFNHRSHDISGGSRRRGNCDSYYGPPNPIICWHGSAVALTAMAEHNNRFGTAGTAINATPYLYYAGTSFEIAEAIRFGVDQGVDVFNISMGSVCAQVICETIDAVSGVDVLADAATYALANRAVIVAASGNFNEDSTVEQVRPCIDPGVICVGRLNHIEPTRHRTSNFGPDIDMWAPGTNIPIAPLPLYVQGQWTAQSGVGFSALSQFQGSSASSPYAAGVVANLKMIDRDLDAATIQTILQATTNPQPNDRYVAPVGTINHLAAVEMIPAGQFSSPTPGSEWERSVELALDLAPGTPVNSVRYEGFFALPNEAPRWHLITTIAGQGPDFPFTWDVSGLAYQRFVQVRATLDGARGIQGKVDETGPFTVQIDRDPPTGMLISPNNNETVGQAVTLAAQVQDNASGVAAVTFEITTSSGVIEIEGEDRDQDGIYTAVWNTVGFGHEVVSIGGLAFDQSGNQGPLTAVTGIEIDLDPAQLEMVYPSPLPSDAEWINTNGTVQVSVRADDPAGISHVEFQATYRDHQQRLVSQTLISDTVPNGGGFFTSLWDVTHVPDQFDQNGISHIQISAVAVDTVGNRSAEEIGYIRGLDRQGPDVRFNTPTSQFTPTGNSVMIDVSATDLFGIGQQVEGLRVIARYMAPGDTHQQDDVLADLSNTTGWSGQLAIANLADQLVTLRAEGIDAAGNRTLIYRSFRINRSAPHIGQISHAPDPFITNGQQFMSFSFTPSERLQNLTIAIKNDQGQLIRELSFTHLNQAPYVIPWDGLDENGLPALSGTYHYDFEALGYSGISSQTPGGEIELIYDTIPAAVQLTISPNPFSYSQAQYLEINISQDEPGYVEVEIFDTNGQMVYFRSAQNETGHTQWLWDGTDFNGNHVPAPADYEVHLRVTDRAGNRSSDQTTIQFKP